MQRGGVTDPGGSMSVLRRLVVEQRCAANEQRGEAALPRRVLVNQRVGAASQGVVVKPRPAVRERHVA